ncbi:MAG: ABC transporter substrate-binding protein [Cypionkella sp.]|uniref:ABC transporter substrate-binding protein n=1 Tax=Cypionkella sp. TaxID=2811411 RepID=UPI002AB9D8E5|nr:ABC transporter substrate-binding protein [Cypionkella sp.]MDZ4312955.1 ABC transporter substrate-binding protein [Cypionkella sp.]MDZ4394217.1 ABC transporter substrate-binding protein [Cypionkella sp.]
MRHAMKGLGRLTLLGLLATTAAQAQTDAELLEAAKAEPPMTAYAVTGKIVDTAEAFSAKYGLSVTGKKVNEAGQIELLIREAQAGNVVGGVSLAADAATIASELMDQGIVESWVPPDLAEHLPGTARNPLVVVSDPTVWAYNSEVYDACPVNNVWQLVDPEWNARVAMMDPLEKPAYADWFNQLEEGHDAEMAAAYQTHYGKPFDPAQGSATEAWVKAFAGNGVLISDSTGVADAIGAPGQTAPFFGMISVAKFRDNTDKGSKLAVCTGVAPFSGWLYPGLGVIAKGTASPNTAKLFISYLMTAEGIAPQSVDGKLPSDPRVGLPVDEASGIAANLDQLMIWNNAGSQSDLDRRQDWQDIWRMSLR